MPCDKTPRAYEPPEELRTRGLSGWIVEDVWIDKYKGWEPHIQALKHENGDLSLRIFLREG